MREARRLAEAAGVGDFQRDAGVNSQQTKGGTRGKLLKHFDEVVTVNGFI